MSTSELYTFIGEKTFLHGYFFFTVNIFADNSLNLFLPDKSTTAIFDKKYIQRLYYYQVLVNIFFQYECLVVT